ncbi:MAG: isoprenyl transferase [Eubacteriales bacterium]|jgi:undecaprenyl diphosphate synthase|nr:isoprenyl transferase [Eubacteriales bacterium]
MAIYSDEEIRAFGLDRDALPKHIAIIMDGNGRWAKKRRLSRSAGHRAGVDRLRGIIRMSSDLEIASLTLYAFSTENWKRPSDEVSTLMALLIEYFTKEIDELFSNNVRIRIIGAYQDFASPVRSVIERAMKRTENNTGLNLNIALNYGSRAEILRAANLAMRQAVAEGKSEITAEMLEGNFYTAGQPEVDLVIRTSGEHRISNFLLYQISYAELLFPEEFWPDFSDEAYLSALRVYQSRSRRFGGLEGNA